MKAFLVGTLFAGVYVFGGGQFVMAIDRYQYGHILGSPGPYYVFGPVALTGALAFLVFAVHVLWGIGAGILEIFE